MIFTSLFKLIEGNLDAVYTFLCKLCEESNSELSVKESRVLNEELVEFTNEKIKDFSHFIKAFDAYTELREKLYSLNPQGHYGYFFNEKDLPLTEMQGDLLILASDYMSLFGREYVKISSPCTSRVRSYV